MMSIHVEGSRAGLVLVAVAIQYQIYNSVQPFKLSHEKYLCMVGFARGKCYEVAFDSNDIKRKTEEKD